MNTLINPTTFIKTHDEVGSYKSSTTKKLVEYTTEIGTVEVTIGKETKICEARRSGDTIYAKGMKGRYNTGGKSWNAVVWVRMNEKGEWYENIDFGRDDRHPKFQKRDAVYFA